jgi:carboxylesterase
MSEVRSVGTDRAGSTVTAQVRAWVPGAEPIALEGGRRGVLLLHGFGDTPQSLRGLATFLHGHGWTVRVPALSGHGSTMDAFTGARAPQWLADARSAFHQLRTSCLNVAVIGQSMGGALATILAAEEQIDSLVLLVPFLRLSPRAAAIAAFYPLVSMFTPLLRSRTDSSIRDPAARSLALGRGVATPRLLRELSIIVGQARHAAPRVKAPTLVIHSRHDPRIPPRRAESAFAGLGAPTKRLEWVERSGHVVSVDYDHDWIASRALSWVESHVAATTDERASNERAD